MNGDVCRLCLGNENLIWIYDEKMAKNMPEIIEGTSGVQINKTDSVTQMVCSTCCQITIKMFKFKTTSIKNDKDLKAKCAGYHISQLTNANSNTKKDAPVSDTGNSSKVTNKVVPVKVPIPQKYKFAHPSIKDIITKYPNLRLPEISLKAHFGAYITLLTDEVDDWYKEKNLSINDIEQIKKRALEYAEAQENSSFAVPRRKRRKISSDVKILTNNKNNTTNTIPDKSISTILTNKKPRSSEDAVGKSIKSVVNTVAKTNTNFDVKSGDVVTNQHKENVDENRKFQLNRSSNSEKSDVMEVNATKTTPKASKPNNNSRHDVMKSTSDNTVKPNKKQRFGSIGSLKMVSSSESGETLTMGAVLHSLLTTDNASEKTGGEITLKSLLQGTSLNKVRNVDADTAISKNTNLLTDSTSKSQDDENTSSIIEIDDTPSENDTFHQKRLTDSHLSLFTTRPFVKISRSDKHHSKNRVDNENPMDGELFILSDSDDEDKTSDKCSDQNACVDSSNNVITEKDNISNTSYSDTLINQNISENIINKDNGNEKIISEDINKNNSNEKSDFIRSLELTPKEAVNMPDLSLVSVAGKINTLYPCNVCDSHYSSLKELKKHSRKIHTKCPFCHKRFRNLANRDEHIKHNCTRNISRFRLKKPKLVLVRIDEVEEIRRKYVSAFKEIENKKTSSEQQTVQESLEEVDKESEILTSSGSPPQTSSSSLPPRPSTPPSVPLEEPPQKETPAQQLVIPQEEQPSEQQKGETAEQLQELEQTAQPSSQQKQKHLQSKQDEQPSQESDQVPQESEERPHQELSLIQTKATAIQMLPSSSSQISASPQNDDSNDTENYDEETADAVRELEKFLENGPATSGLQQKEVSTNLNSDTDKAISNATSVAGATSNDNDIICISDDESEAVNNTHNVSNRKPKIKVINNDILNNLNLLDNDTDIIERILTESLRQKHGGGVKISGLKDNTIVDGGSSKIKVFKNLRKHLQHYKIPIEISYSPVLNVEYRYAKVPSQKKLQDAWPTMVPLDLRTPSVSTSGTSTYSTHRNAANTSSRNTASVIVHPQATSSKTVVPSNVFQSNLNRSERQMNVTHVTQFNNTQESVPSSHNLILTSAHNPMLSSTSLNHTLTTNGPVILNSTQNVYATSNCSSYSNFILLPTSLVSTSANATVTTLPSTQGPLPVIQSVSSGPEIPVGLFSSGSSTQPSIRVRNLSELS